MSELPLPQEIAVDLFGIVLALIVVIWERLVGDKRR
jgi:hypothetical protein